MVQKYDKSNSQSLSDHFDLNEFHCHCTYPDCSYTLVDSNLVNSLETLREVTGPISINDGYRCSRHNADVGGVPGSQHMLGKASDIVSALGPNLTAFNAEQGPFKNGGVGRYSTFTHVDCRGYTARWRKGI